MNRWMKSPNAVARTQSMDSPVASDVAGHLRLVVTRLARRLRQHADVGVSPTQLSVLATIERRGPITLGDLASAESVQPPTITAVIGRLEEQGLVRRKPDTIDRRVARAEVTPAGRDIVHRSRSRKTAYLNRRLRVLTDDELATLDAAATILDRLLAVPDDEGAQP